MAERRGVYLGRPIKFILLAIIFLLSIGIVFALPYINFSDAQPSFLRSGPSNVGNNSFIGGAAFVFNVSISAASSTGGNFYNISNVSFYMTNRTGTYLLATLSNGTNATNGTRINGEGSANSTYLFTFTNDTTRLTPNDNLTNLTFTVQAFQFNTTNQSMIVIREENVTITNVSIVNTNPTVTINDAAGNLSNVTVGFTAVHGATDLLNQTLSCNFTLSTQFMQDQSNVTNGTAYQFKNATNGILNNLNGNNTYTIACIDQARDSRSGFTNGGSASTTFKLDTKNPVIAIEFRDSNNVVDTTFDFGEEITIDCNPSDVTSGINTAKINATIIKPDEPTAQNLTAISQANTTLGEVSFTDTTELGDYNVTCTAVDFLGFINVSNKIFTIAEKTEAGTSAFAIPSFKSPMAKKVIAVGVVNYLGELTTDPILRLIAEKGGITINIEGKDYTITADKVEDTSVTLLIGDADSITLNEGDTKQIDVDADNVNELEVFLNMIYNNKADISFKKIEVEAAPKEEPAKKEETTPAVVESTAKSNKKSVIGIIIFVVVIAVLIMVALHFVRRKGEGNLKFKPRDLGSNRDSSEDFYSRTIGSPPPPASPPSNTAEKPINSYKRSSRYGL